MTDTSLTKTSYHHGDLRESLLEVASRLLETDGIDGLSMRKLAEQVGVSRSASYHHFADKRALLCALAAAGFQQQDHFLATLAVQQGVERFRAFVRAYITFATTHRAQYDLMYGREIWKTGVVTDNLEQAAKQSFKRWLEEVVILREQGVLSMKPPALRVAQVSWAALHGLCRLVNDGIYVNAEDIGEMEEALVKMLTRVS